MFSNANRVRNHVRHQSHSSIVILISYNRRGDDGKDAISEVGIAIAAKA